jgi:hypothetical protein
MSPVTIAWFGAKILQEFKMEMKRRAMRAARTLANQLADNIDTPGPQASAPGEFPHAQTRELLYSINVHDDGEMGASVSVDAEHARFVEKSRPFFDRTIRDCERRIEKILSAPMD